MFLFGNFKENCQRNILISNLNAFTFFRGINSVKIGENNRLGNGEKSQISTQIKSHVSWVRFRLVAHQIWDISGESEIVSLSLRFDLSKSQVGGPRPWCSRMTSTPKRQTIHSQSKIKTLQKRSSTQRLWADLGRSGPRATNAEIYSNLRFLRKFEFFSGFCATKPITISNSDLLLSFFSNLRFALKSEIFLKRVCHQLFSDSAELKSWDFSENLEFFQEQTQVEISEYLYHKITIIFLILLRFSENFLKIIRLNSSFRKIYNLQAFS